MSEAFMTCPNRQPADTKTLLDKYWTTVSSGFASNSGLQLGFRGTMHYNKVGSMLLNGVCTYFSPYAAAARFASTAKFR